MTVVTVIHPSQLVAFMTLKDAKEQFERGYWRTLYEYERVIVLPGHKHHLEIKKFALQDPKDVILECRSCSARFFYVESRLRRLLTNPDVSFDISFVKQIFLLEPFIEKGYILRLEP